MTGETDESNPSLLQRLQSPNIAPSTPDTTTPPHSPLEDINAHLIRAATLCLGLTQDQIDNNQSHIVFFLNMLESLEFVMRRWHSTQGRGEQHITIRNLVKNVEALTEVVGDHSIMMDRLIDSFLQVAQQSNSLSPTTPASPFLCSNRSLIYSLVSEMLLLSPLTNFLLKIPRSLKGHRVHHNLYIIQETKEALWRHRIKKMIMQRLLINSLSRPSKKTPQNLRKALKSLERQMMKSVINQQPSAKTTRTNLLWIGSMTLIFHKRLRPAQELQSETMKKNLH